MSEPAAVKVAFREQKAGQKVAKKSTAAQKAPESAAKDDGKALPAEEKPEANKPARQPPSEAPESKKSVAKKSEAKPDKAEKKVAKEKAKASEPKKTKPPEKKPAEKKATAPKVEAKAPPQKKEVEKKTAKKDPEADKPAARKRDPSKLKSQAEKAAAEVAKSKQDKPKAEKPEAKKPAPKKRKPAKPVEDPAKRFRRLIRENGPISLAQFMGESNALYYTSRDPLGEEGDFITAPEVSQMFGELIGLWLADIWVRAGAPKKVHYVELGPGRGTLALDALRTASRYDLNPTVHFVEGSEALREIQSEAIPDVQHHHDLSTIPTDAPILLVANEFFDALPVHQLLRAAQGWTERMIGLDGEKFVFVGGDKPMDSIVPSSWKSAPQGTLIETSPAAAAVMSEIGDRLVEQGGVALVVDYGGLEHRAGSSLQALKAHKKVDPLEMPGQADITAHVDFEMLGQVAKRQGAKLMGMVMQGDWLRDLGIETRTEALQRKAGGDASKIARQRDRLIAEGEMGLLFKVMGLGAPEWPDGVGF